MASAGCTETGPIEVRAGIAKDTVEVRCGALILIMSEREAEWLIDQMGLALAAIAVVHR